MATSLDTPSPRPRIKQLRPNVMNSSPVFSPSSDKRFWSTLRGRIDSLLEDRQHIISDSHYPSTSAHNLTVRNEQSNRLKEDSLLLMRGFDSVAHTLSLLSNNLDNALQGARELGNPPTLTDIFQSKIDKAEENKEEDLGEQQKEESKQGIKRKLDIDNVDSSEEINDVDSQEINDVDSQTGNAQKMPDKHIKKAKNLAVSMANKAATLARELKSIKSDLCFMQDRCSLLEEENRRLRDGLATGIRPEEDDLVRLQLEALLGEKARLANENANLVRENQCLHQLVEYHQVTASQDFSESYDNVIQGMHLDFSSSPSTIAEEGDGNDINREESQTPKKNIFNFCNSLEDEGEREE